MREVRADDAQRMQAAMRAMSDESRHARFMSALRELSPQMLERATRPDAEREFQLVAVAGEDARQKIVGGAYKRAEDVMTKHRKALDAIAKQLIEVETLEREEFEKILIANGIVPKKKEDIEHAPLA